MKDATIIVDDLIDLLNDEDVSLANCILAIIKAGEQLKEIANEPERY